MHGTGNMEDVHGAATKAGSFGAEAAVGFHESGAVEFREMEKSAFPTLLEQRDLLVRLLRRNLFPILLEPECVDEFRFLNFPDGEGEILGNDLDMHGFGAGLADVEFEQG